MTRKRIKHEQLPNENKRNSILSKRAEGLVKKAEQLQILCGVDIAIIGHRQTGESNAILWPSPEAVAERVNKFMEFPTIERNKKMVTHEKYVEQNVNSERENMAKLKRATEVKEGHHLLAKKPVDMMQMLELDLVEEMVAEMLKNLKVRAAEVGLPTPADSRARTGAAPATEAEDQGLMRAIVAVGADKWFSNSPGGSSDGTGGSSLGFGGFSSATAASGSSSSFVGFPGGATAIGGSSSGVGGFSGATVAAGSSSSFARFCTGIAAVGGSSTGFGGFFSAGAAGGSSSVYAGFSGDAFAGSSSSRFAGFSGGAVVGGSSSGFGGFSGGTTGGGGSSSGFGGFSNAAAAGGSSGGFGGFSSINADDFESSSDLERFFDGDADDASGASSSGFGGFSGVDGGFSGGVGGSSGGNI
ncbi:uncharacterized protein LOC127266250 [Andrographis paniculata]|uniref:uncharacterized protein LOC127266250 n=1 Tax=Andrographis paniculata TaxID=175694 RepID=UPI0021E90B77|nr:uncharacterized protein LOC127266250 [Andrographis paniculata]